MINYPAYLSTRLKQNAPNFSIFPHSLSSQGGFTLLELALSMFLTTLLLVTLSAGMYSVVNDWQRDTSSLDELLDESLVLLQVEKSLIAAFPHTYVDRERLARFVYFKGTHDELSWVSTISPQRQQGLTAWHIFSDNSDGLQLSLTPAYSDNPEGRLSEVVPTPLLSNYSAQFRYLLQVEQQEKEWRDEWSGEEMQSLPLAVQIIFTPYDKQAETFEVIAPIKNHLSVHVQSTSLRGLP